MSIVTALSNPVLQDLVDKLFFAHTLGNLLGGSTRKKPLFHILRALLLSADDTDECLPSPAKLSDAPFSPREKRIHKGHLMFPPRGGARYERAEYSISLLARGAASQSIIIISEGWAHTRGGIRRTAGMAWRTRRGGREGKKD